MDLASLQNEIREKCLPPLVDGWSNEDFFKLLKMYEDKCSLETLATHFEKIRGQISGLLHRARAKGLVSSVRPRQTPTPAVPKEPKLITTVVPFNVATLVKRIMSPKPVLKRRI